MKKYSFGLLLLMFCANFVFAQRSLSRIDRVDSSPKLTPTTEQTPTLTPINENPEPPAGPVNPSGGAPVGERNVVWVHGWEGSVKSWGVYSRKYGRDIGADNVRREGERKMNCLRVDYAQGGPFGNHPDYAQNVVQAATIVKRQVANAQIMPSDQNIFIGHSLGGLTTRQIDRADNGTNLFGGFITVGTPNKGAIIAQAVMEGRGDKFVDEAIRAVVAPFYDTWVGMLVIGLSSINDDFQLIRRVFPIIGPAEDLSPNSNLIKDLNGQNGFTHGNKKIIAISARESGQKLWCELSSIALNPPSELPLHQVGDEDMGRKMARLEGMYNSAGYVSTGWAVVSTVFGGWFVTGKWAVRAKLFFNGASWIKNAPAAWNNLLGANRTEQRTVASTRIKQSVMNDYNAWQDARNCEMGRNGRPSDCGWTAFLASLSAAQRADMYEPSTTTVSVQIVNEGNDGIVLQSSANGLTEGPNVLNLEMELRPDFGVNHQECMNHLFVTDKFESIFNGTAGSRTDDHRDFFKIPKR